jgi:hypothetical protein
MGLQRLGLEWLDILQSVYSRQMQQLFGSLRERPQEHFLWGVTCVEAHLIGVVERQNFCRAGLGSGGE